MSIAIPTYAPGAITSYVELLDEIRDMMDDADYSQRAIDRALRKAEAEFNRSLRVPDMETRFVMTITDELSTLPLDFLEMRFLFAEGAPDNALVSMSPAGMVQTYGGRSGTPMAYSIEGTALRIGPVGKLAVEMIYYQRIPSLTDGQVSNWLLRKHPDLYVAGVMYHLARRERDRDGQAQALQELGVLIERVNDAGKSARWGAAPLIPQGVRQVSLRVRI